MSIDHSWKAEGRTSDIDAADGFEDIVEDTAAIDYPTAAALATEFVSSSTADDVAGTGARRIRVFGIDAAGEYSEVVYDTDGTTEVALDPALRRVLGIEVLDVGTDASPPTGAIDVRLADNTVIMRLAAARGKTTGGYFTVPKGFVAHLVRWGVYANAADAVTPGCDFRLMVRHPIDLEITDEAAGDYGEFFVIEAEQRLGSTGATTQVVREFFDLDFPPFTDIRVEVDTDVDNTVAHTYLDFHMSRQ